MPVIHQPFRQTVEAVESLVEEDHLGTLGAVSGTGCGR